MILLIIVLAFISIAVILTWFLLSHNEGHKEPVAALWAAAGFGLLGFVLAGLIESFVIPKDLINNSAAPLGGVFMATLAIGAIEESCKFIPLALFIYRKKYFAHHSDGVIFFAIAGLGFGLPENILYAVEFGAQTGLARVVLTPIFHAAITGMVGYFLARSKVEHKSLKLPALFLLVAVVLHALYDFGLMSERNVLTLISLMITAAVTAMLFVFFMRSKELDQNMGLVYAHNFCRNCGGALIGTNQYCTSCGLHV